MNAIVNVTENWGIGQDNRLLISISADLKRFRQLTTGRTVVLGRKTLETFPGGRPLRGRRNLILSGNPSLYVNGATVVHSMAELRDAILPGEPLSVIGGASVYELLLPYCDTVYVTKTLIAPPADRFFPNLDALPDWELAKASEIFEETGVRFQYLDYTNRNPLPL